MAVSKTTEAVHAAWIEPMARLGYATRGVVYLVIGALAVFAAFGPTQVEGAKGAFAVILSQPFGQVLLWLVVAGLAGFAAWRVLQAALDTDNRGTGAKGIAIRIGLAGSGALHLGLALLAAAMVLGWKSAAGGGGSADPSGRWLGAIYQAGFGQVLTWAVALLVLVVAAAQMRKGYSAGFDPFFRHCPPDVMRWVRPLGRIGLIARGVTFLIIAVLIFYGGLRYGSVEGGATPGLADALSAVEGYTFGWLILLFIALGLIAFGLFALAAARYRRMI